MKSNVWQLQEARNHLSEVVELARVKGIQTITKHGKAVAVVMAVGDFRRLGPGPSPKNESLLDLLRRCPEPGIFESLEEARRQPDYGRTIDLR